MTAPDDDIDFVAVERAIDGDLSVPLTHAEMGAAWRALEARGESLRAIGVVLGVSWRTVARWRSSGYPAKRIGPRWLRDAS